MIKLITFLFVCLSFVHAQDARAYRLIEVTVQENADFKRLIEFGFIRYNFDSEKEPALPVDLAADLEPLNTELKKAGKLVLLSKSDESPESFVNTLNFLSSYSDLIGFSMSGSDGFETVNSKEMYQATSAVIQKNPRLVAVSLMIGNINFLFDDYSELIATLDRSIPRSSPFYLYLEEFTHRFQEKKKVVRAYEKSGKQERRKQMIQTLKDRHPNLLVFLD